MEVVWGDELGVGAMKLIGKRVVMWVGVFDPTWLIDFVWVGSMMLGCTLVEVEVVADVDVDVDIAEFGECEMECTGSCGGPTVVDVLALLVAQWLPSGVKMGCTLRNVLETVVENVLEEQVGEL